MHSYSISTNERESVANYLIGFAILLAAIWGLIQTYAIKIPWWWESPAILGIFEFVRRWFSKTLWRRNLQIWRTGIPDLAGTWVGTYESTHNGVTGPISMTIAQDWSRMGISIVAQESRSHSICSAIVGEENNLRLEYSYDNRPKGSPANTLQPHLGFVRLHICHSREAMEGEYFTDRQRQTGGALKLKRVSKDYLSYEDALKLAPGVATPTGVT